MVHSLAGAGASVDRDPETDVLVVNKQFRVAIVVARYEVTQTGSPRWTLRFDRDLNPDLTIAVRMNGSNATRSAPKRPPPS